MLIKNLAERGISDYLICLISNYLNDRTIKLDADGYVSATTGIFKLNLVEAAASKGYADDLTLIIADKVKRAGGEHERIRW